MEYTCNWLNFNTLNFLAAVWKNNRRGNHF